MNLPGSLPDGCILLLLIIWFHPHAWLLKSKESEHDAIRVARVVAVRVRVAVVVDIVEVRRVRQRRAAKPIVRGRQRAVEYRRWPALPQGLVSLPVFAAQAGKDRDFLVDHARPFVHDVLAVLHDVP